MKMRRAWLGMAGAVVLAAGALALVARAQTTPAPPEGSDTAEAPAGAPPPGAAPRPALPIPPGALPPVPAKAAPSPTVRIVFTTVPMKKATVMWGKRRLGVIAPKQPLVVDRPRDSGPLDVLVRSDGYLTVQTRAYTFADAKVAVKLTPVAMKKSLLGYREEVPPEGAPGPDGGVAPPSSSPDGGAR